MMFKDELFIDFDSMLLSSLLLLDFARGINYLNKILNLKIFLGHCGILEKDLKKFDFWKRGKIKKKF